MQLVKKVKDIYNVIVGDTKEKKLEIILDHIIDTIELRGDDVYIKTKKNIAIQNDGHFVQVNSGVHVMLSSQIHLNPKITETKQCGDTCKDIHNLKFNKLQETLDEACRIEDEKLQLQVEEHQKRHSSFHI